MLEPCRLKPASLPTPTSLQRNHNFHHDPHQPEPVNVDPVTEECSLSALVWRSVQNTQR